MAKKATIISIENLTYNVYRIQTTKPEGIKYRAGQAVSISINKTPFKSYKNTFSLASLPEENHLEFIIKVIPDQSETLTALVGLFPGEELLIYEPFGGISYKGEGIFIAGGVGIAPFIAILKNLEKQNEIGNNKLIFANRTAQDIFLEEEFQKLMGENYINILSEEKNSNYEYGTITPEFIKKQKKITSDYFYLCGPPFMISSVESQLLEIGIEKKYIIKEEF